MVEIPIIAFIIWAFVLFAIGLATGLIAGTIVKNSRK